MLPTAGYQARRERGGWAADQARSVARAGFDRSGAGLLASRDPGTRRLGFQIARELGRIDYAEQVHRAGPDRDSVIRRWAADAACADAVRRGDRATLRSLARARFAGVRLVALVGLARLGHPRAEVRRAGYRLTGSRSYPERLRAALRVAADEDPGLAARGRADAFRLLRAAAAGGGEWLPVAGRAELVRLAERAGDDAARLAEAVRTAPGE